MKTLKMDSYEVYVESGLIKEVAGLIMKATTSRKAMLISDSNVASLYSEAVLGKLNNNGFETEMFIFEAGEENKNINTLDNILGAMSNFSLSRSDIVIALGGGVVSDLVGFAASIYLRGIDFIAVPTTLLAQIDAAVGGKNGCDLKNGKNLIGSFYNPRMVIVDPQLLETLPKTVFNDGLAEAVKYGVIRSKKLFEALRDNEPEDFIEDLIYECLKIKIHLVENDFRDNGERMILNFGHTVAHAIEQYYNYKEITHGQAVSIGMVTMAEAAEKNGLLKEGIAAEISGTLRKYELPTYTTIPTQKLSHIALSDKKRRGNIMNLILIKDIGEAYIKKINAGDLSKFLNGGVEDE